MRIGIDARPIQGPFTGDSTYWRGLIGGFARLDSDVEFMIYLDGKLPKPDLPASETLRIRVLRAINSRLWSAWVFPRALRADGVRMAHVQYTIPPRMPCPTVTSIQDVSFKRFPEFFGLKDRLILDLAVKQAGKRAARIVAPSEYTRAEITSLYGIDPEKIAVVYLAADEHFRPVDRHAARRVVSERYGLESAFVLSVGVIQPRKNLHRLLEGFAKLKGIRRSDHKLVIVGKYGWKESGLEQRISKLGIAGEVDFAGYAPDDDLPALYSAADVFVYPSVYEGFGLPPLEAMACGTPVITGDRTSLPEVVGEAGIMVDPFDPGAFADAMARVLADESLRREMAVRGVEQAKKFSWDKTARQTLEIYRSVTKTV